MAAASDRVVTVFGGTGFSVAVSFGTFVCRADPIAIAVEPETADPCVAGDILDSVWCAGIIEIPKWIQRAMATGIVKWFNPTKGYGFIQPQGKFGQKPEAGGPSLH